MAEVLILGGMLVAGYVTVALAVEDEEEEEEQRARYAARTARGPACTGRPAAPREGASDTCACMPVWVRS